MYTFQVMNVFEILWNGMSRSVASARIWNRFHRVNLFKLSYPVEWLDFCMESVNLFRPCLPASSAVPIQIRPMWRIGSVGNPWNHRFSFAICTASIILLERPDIFKWSFKPPGNVVFFTNPWGETCQCWAENYQGLELGELTLLDTDDTPEKSLRTWRKTNASRSTIRRKWICPRQFERNSSIFDF